MLWSAVIFVSMAGHLEEDPVEKKGVEPLLRPQFFYALKIRKAHWNCVGARNFKGLLYECGVMYSSGGKSLWASFETGIDPATGHIEVFKTYHHVTQRLPNGYAFKKKVCDYPWDKNDQKVTSEEWHKAVVAFAFNTWNARDDMWKVSTTTADTRVVFLVPWGETKHYFKDRKVDALTPNGTKKRIIHHVKEHTRVRDGKEIVVKEHIRGLRTFEWKEYRCAVTAPKFHAFDTDAFESASTDVVTVNPEQKRTLYGPSVMAALSAAEDSQSSDPVQNLINGSSE